MAIQINGTSGISGVDGSAATPALQGTDTNSGISFPAADTVAINTGGSERVRCDSSGRVGIGTTSPAGRLHVSSSGTGTSAGSNIVISARSEASGRDAAIQFADGTTSAYVGMLSGSIYFADAGSTERARIDSSGRLLVGTSSASGGTNARALIAGNTNSAAGVIQIASTSASPASGDALGVLRFSDSGHTQASAINCERDGGTWTSGSSQPTRLVFSTTADGASSPTERFRISANGNLTAGYIPSSAGTVFLKWNGGTGLISYDSSSRLIKENIEDSDYGLNEIMQLKPRKYWRKDDQRQEVGFIADEVAAVMPEFAPMGAKSTITGNDDDTEQIPVSVNYDKLTAVLTKALQEAIGEIESLKARVAALEAA